MIRIGFLLNHDAAHQVLHCIPAAYELARRNPEISVHIIITTDEESEGVERIAANYPGVSCKIEVAKAPGYATAFDKMTGHALLAKRFGVLWHHRKWFATFDALVCPDKTSLVLKRWLGDDCPYIINTGHGAGDRAGGFKGLERFDYHLFHGPKYAQRMKAEGQVTDDRYSVIGYVKFDCLTTTPQPSLFSNDRPTVVYSPHFDPKVSSWFEWGEFVLRFFADNTQYNLIFAPHVLLFKRRWHISLTGGLPKRTPGIPEFARQSANILVDEGSLASIDMTYLRAADIYMGDVSSLVNEFLVEPRACIFLNSKGVAWQGDPNYLFWETGDVVGSLEELPSIMNLAVSEPDRYLAQQQHVTREAFELTDTPSSIRAADAIVSFLVSEGKIPASATESTFSS
jgi:hypothetical protein